jgi:hypothetical protein
MIANVIDEDDDLLRTYCLPEEEITVLTASMPHASRTIGGFRWFRSANVIDIWQYRQPQERQWIVERLRYQLRLVS